VIDAALLAGLIAASTVDRAGIPYSLIGGLVFIGPAPSTAALFVAGCAVAGAIGDLGCYAVGARWLRGRVPELRPAASERAWVDRACSYLRPVRARTPGWLVAGKLSNPANVAITIAAGAIGYGAARTFAWCLLGSGLWIGLFGAGVYHAAGPLRELSAWSAAAITTAVTAVLFGISRLVDRRLSGRA
jgi:hypothetical protein